MFLVCLLVSVTGTVLVSLWLDNWEFFILRVLASTVIGVLLGMLLVRLISHHGPGG
jgi:hypothetical protein